METPDNQIDTLNNPADQLKICELEDLQANKQNFNDERFPYIGYTQRYQSKAMEQSR